MMRESVRIRALLLVRLSFTAILMPPVIYFLWLCIRCFLMDYFSIPTSSMQPTLMPKDEVAVNKLLAGARIYSDLDFDKDGTELKSWRTKGLRHIRLGDLIVFNFPHHGDKINFVINNVFCKRVMALPGDTLTITDGYYKNNNYEGVLGLGSEQRKFSSMPDSILPISILNIFPFDEHFPGSTKNMLPLYVPRRGDVIKTGARTATFYRMILEWELKAKVTWDWETDEAFADAKVIKRHEFQHDYYFVAGDNVADSYDSRYWGLVPEEYIVGVVSHVLRKDGHGAWRFVDFYK